MATVLNRTTKQLVVSANTPDYPIAQWIIEPDLTAVTKGDGSLHPSKYWIITGDAVSLMTPTEMDAVDAAELSTARDATSARLDMLEDIARASTLVTLDEINLHASRVTAILDAVDAATSLADLKTRVAAIADVPQRTITQYKNAVRNKLGT